MKKILVLFALILVVGCSEQLPPVPPPPGESGHGLIGKAIVQPSAVPTGILPPWAAEEERFSAPNVILNESDVFEFQVEGDYALGKAYAYNKFAGIWEALPGNAQRSGQLVGNEWFRDKGVYELTIDPQRFKKGQENYVVTYPCNDLGEDAQGNKIWSCQKWRLSRFWVQLYPDILIELPIGNEIWKNSSRDTTPDGVEYNAYYETTTFGTDVYLLTPNNMNNYEQQLNVAQLAPTWTNRAGTCGFLSSAGGDTTFFWKSGGQIVTVVTHTNALDDDIVFDYNNKYPSDCNWLAHLQGVPPGAVCGNNVAEPGEVCDGTDDAACGQGWCKPDCTCQPAGPGAPVCGDGIAQTPEECDPPQTGCFVRDPVTGQILGQGACTATCTCQLGAQPQAACDDTDNYNYFFKGEITNNTGTFDDVCQNANTLIEQTCDGPKKIDCPHGCDQGICRPAPPEPFCPDALAVWTHNDTVRSNAKDIWYSAYWDGDRTWAPLNETPKTGEAAPIEIFDGEDYDPDISTWAAIGTWCGEGMTVWANQRDPQNPPAIVASRWTMEFGWEAPTLVSEIGYDPAIAYAQADGRAVAIWVLNDSLWYAKYDGFWDAPMKLVDAVQPSIPQITHNPGIDEWIAVWTENNEPHYAYFDWNVWHNFNQIPAQVYGGDLILPSTRNGVHSQWFDHGPDTETTGAWTQIGALDRVIEYIIHPSQASRNYIMNNPDVCYDWRFDRRHVIGMESNGIDYIDENMNTPLDAASTPFVDGRPAFTYLYPTDIAVAVWHSVDEGKPHLQDVYWSRRDPQTGWSPADHLVKPGHEAVDLNTDIAPLFGYMAESDSATSKPKIPPCTPPTTEDLPGTSTSDPREGPPIKPPWPGGPPPEEPPFEPPTDEPPTDTPTTITSTSGLNQGAIVNTTLTSNTYLEPIEYEVNDVTGLSISLPPSDFSIQTAVILIAALGILGITLLNFVYKD